MKNVYVYVHTAVKYVWPSFLSPSSGKMIKQSIYLDQTKPINRCHRDEPQLTIFKNIRFSLFSLTIYYVNCEK